MFNELKVRCAKIGKQLHPDAVVHQFLHSALSVQQTLLYMTDFETGVRTALRN